MLLRTADCQAPPASLSRPLGLRASLLATAEAKSEHKDKYKSTITMTITNTETKTNKQLTQQPASKLDRLPRLPLGPSQGLRILKIAATRPQLELSELLADIPGRQTTKQQIVQAEIEHILNLTNPEMEKTKVFLTSCSQACTVCVHSISRPPPTLSRKAPPRLSQNRIPQTWIKSFAEGRKIVSRLLQSVQRELSFMTFSRK